MKKNYISAIVLFISTALSSLSICYLLQIHWAVSIPIFLAHFIIWAGIWELVEKIIGELEQILLNSVATIIALCVFIFTALSPVLLDDKAFEKATFEASIGYYQKFIERYPRSKYVQQAQDSINCLKQWEENKLQTGSTPYVDIYGKNLEYGEVSIHVKGQSKSDQIVIIQSEDFNGLVVAHAYIRADDEYTFNLPNGTYQVSFYRGSGWNPHKKMGRFTGGFIKGEHFMKDWTMTLKNESKVYDFSPYSSPITYLYDICDREDIFK